MRREGLLRALLGGLVATTLWAAAPVAQAIELEDRFRDTITQLALIMHRNDYGRTTPAQIYIRQPRDNSQGVVCTPLSNYIARKFRSALNLGLIQNSLTQAKVVPRLKEGETQLVVNLSWRRRDDQLFDIITSIGQYVDGRDAEFFSSDLTTTSDELNRDERRCLFRLAVKPEWRSAKEQVIVYQSIDNFQDTLGLIDVDQRYRILGRIEGKSDWALVRMFRQAPAEPGQEDIGFAFLPPDGFSRQELVDSLAAAKADLAAMEDRNGELEGEIEALLVRVGEGDAAAIERDTAREELLAARQRNRNLATRISELNGEIGGLTLRVEDLQGRLADAAEEGGATAEELRRELATSQAEGERMRRQLASAQSSLAKGQRDMNSLRGELAQATYSRTQAAASKARAEADLAAALKQRDDLRLELETLRAQPDTSGQLTRLQNQVQDLNAKITSYRAQARRYNSEISALNVRIRNSEREIATLNAEVAEKTRESNRLAQTNKSLRAQVDTLNRKLAGFGGGGSVGSGGGTGSVGDRIRVLNQVDFDNSSAKWLDRKMTRNVSHEGCKSICRRDRGCKYYTYNTQNNTCFTKSGFAKRSSYQYAISGELIDRIGR